MNYDVWPGIGLTDTPFDWAKFTGSAALSAKSTANVDRRRKTEGKDFSTFRGISRKSDELGMRGAPAKMRKHRGGGNGGAGGRPLMPGSMSSKIREALAHGPMTRAQLCAATGLKSGATTGFLANDIKQGRILKIVKEGELQRFALAGNA